MASRPAPGTKADKNWHVYIVRCNDNSFYTGVTTNPARRIAKHNQGTASKYTRSRLPVKLVYLESASSRGDALRREYVIRKMPAGEKLRLIETRPAAI